MTLSDMLCDVELLANDNLPEVVLAHDAKGNLVLLLAGDVAASEADDVVW